jgi:dipeptidyl aminopeptidase/acylaminoacyl peptidase
LRGRHWAWNAEAQFLASRGYVVIEPEFRGSAGYGVDHFKSGWKQWGTAMQDDVADAALWAVARGLVDPKRICIAGGSYGGYAALMGPIRNPEVYRCAVAYAAVTDPRLLYDKSWASDIQRQTREYTLPQLMGDLVTDADLLKSATPVERASELRVPVFLAFGRNDRRVPLEHGIRMRSALQAAGREPGWVVYDDEAHGWFKPENRIDFWQRTEQFLARHLQ